MRIFLKPLFGLGILVLSYSATAGWFGADFSAEAVQIDNQSHKSTGYMYVGKGRVRTELKKDGQSVIEILDPLKGVALLILPGQQTYLERVLPPTNVASADSKGDGNPCHELNNMKCTSLGEEVINGRKARKWEIVNSAGDVAYQWSDLEHRFAVKREYKGATLLELQYLGNERVNERDVEKWKSTVENSDGTKSVSTQWYDGKLNIAVRQEMSDGSLRELRNIKVEPQSDVLFAVPDGFNKMVMPVQQ